MGEKDTWALMNRIIDRLYSIYCWFIGSETTMTIDGDRLEISYLYNPETGETLKVVDIDYDKKVITVERP